MHKNTEEPSTIANHALSVLRENILRLSEAPPPSAKSVVGELKVVRISLTPIELWVVMGRESDYLVIRGTYCSCPHFVIRVVNGESTTPCYHLVAVEIAVKQGRFHDLSLSLSKDELQDIVLEVLAGSRSTTLRKKLYALGRREEEG